ncbi:TonB-dependent receptor [Chryseolinea sp. T2]|uniref:SusC/RagA family TonB-linked outer membrane protein n=1 Tax=Chryseolinea sp. T2 TaxID=3129255 RepID=UPI0030781C43
MIRKLLFTCLMLSLLVTVGLAQSKQVTGQVTSKADGTTLPGVNVVVLGTTKGTTTDVNGNYTIQLAASENTLVYSFVGFSSQTVQVGDQTTINVVLEEDATSLEEVVVVGYGTQREKDLTSAISTVKSEEITRMPSAQAMQSLQGKVPGLQIVSAGAPGETPVVRVRGLGSYPGKVVGQNNENPLYVVNGVFFDNIDFLNPTDIESISVLKDASAAAIYGVRAANGVILITTKTGKFNQPAQITYDGYYGAQVAQNVLKMANSEQFATMANESGSPNDIAAIGSAMQRYGRSRVNPNVPDVNTDWYDQTLRVAPIQNHSLTVAGGGENTTYSVAGNYFQQDGILTGNNSYERFNLRMNLDYHANDWLTVGGNIVISNAVKQAPDSAVWNDVYFAVPTLPKYDPNLTTAVPINYANAQDIGYRNGQNPFPTIDFIDDQYKTHRFLTNFYVKIDLIKDKLTFQTTYNNGSSFQNRRKMLLPYFIGTNFKRENASLLRVNETSVNQIWDNILTYNGFFGDHSLTVMGGVSFRDEAYERLTATGVGFTDLSKENWYLHQAQNISTDLVDDAGQRYYGLSYFGRVAYNYKDKYLAYATFRADGSSKYQQTWGYFPSFGVGWVLSEENFMANSGFIDFLKLRASYGVLGNDKINASSGSNVTSQILTVFGDVIASGETTSSTFSYLKWEATKEWNFGLTSRFLNNRLAIDADYYIRDTEQAAIQVTAPTGETFNRSLGVIRNSGFEFSGTWSDNFSEDFRYNIGANFATLKNETRDIYGQAYIDGGSAEFLQRTIVGHPLLAFFGYETNGVYQNNEEVAADPVAVANGLVPGDFKYKDLNNDGLINADDRTILGSFLPKITYGANVGIGWKNFDLNVDLMGQAGNKILNRKRGEYNWTSDANMDADLAKNRWHGEGTTNDYPSSAGLRRVWNLKMSDFFVEDGSFFRIQNVQLGYRIKGAEVFGARMPETRISLTATRPLTVFKYNGFNPELGNGIDTQTYPIPAIYTVGLNVKF